MTAPAPGAPTSPSAAPAPVLVNTSFARQRITGQQRYAHEISSRLLARAGFTAIGPRGVLAGSSLRVWAWVLGILPLLRRGRVLLSLTARAPLAPQILVVHDLFVLTNPEWFSRVYVITHAPLLRLQLRLASAAVAVSEPVALELAERFRGPIVVAPNAPSDVFRARAASSAVAGAGSAGDPAGSGTGILSRHGLTDGGYLLTVGSIDPRKNLARLAEAYAALDDGERARTPLVVAGGGAGVFRGEELRWPGGTVLVGYVSDEELRELYAGAGAVVFPSRAEGFGLPLVEAAAAGTRALAISDIPVFRWICGDGAVYFDPDSTTDLTAALRRVVAEPVAPRIDLDRFDWDASAAVVASVCATAAGHPAPETERAANA